MKISGREKRYFKETAQSTSPCEMIKTDAENLRGKKQIGQHSGKIMVTSQTPLKGDASPAKRGKLNENRTFIHGEPMMLFTEIGVVYS